MKIELNNIKIAKSALTDKVFIGIVNKDKRTWRQKKDVTSDFMKTVVDRFCGYEEIFILNNKKYKIKVIEVDKNE